jgi:hypothetical protein
MPVEVLTSWHPRRKGTERRKERKREEKRKRRKRRKEI